MKKAAFHSSGRLDIDMYINRFRLQRFVFTAADEDFAVTAFTWQLNIRQNVGAQVNYVSYSIGFGLSFPVYETNVIEARFAANDLRPQGIMGEGKKYWELVRTDTNEIWLSGEMNFQYGLLDSGGLDQEVTINLVNETVEVQLQSIVHVDSVGGSGTFSIPDYTAFEADGLPTGVSAGYIAKIVTVDPDYQQTIDGVQYFNNKIIYFDGTNWTSWAADYGGPV